MSDIQYPLVVVGAQWGDEGKGKLVDVLAQHADVVIRYNGGNNAGHTVMVGDDVFKLSLLPSGVAQKKHLVIAQGCVVDPKVLLDEIQMIQEHHLPVHLSIDPRVHLVMPYHKALDRATELWKGKKATGSLHLGIGYCYEDKNNRFGIRLDDLFHPTILKEKIIMISSLHLKRIQMVYGQKEKFNINAIYHTYLLYGKKLKKYTEDTSILVEKAMKTKNVLFEGAHGTLLDPVFGTYPYTVAIHTISGGIFPYVGIAPQAVNSLGIVKSYTTRVGNGPFPTELHEATGETLRAKGHEFGTVSKRPRRCGWLDIPALRTATRLSGFTSLAITKLDVLSGLPSINVCVSYTINKKRYTEIPASTYEYEHCKPVYRRFRGWNKDLSGLTSWKDVPIEAKRYIHFIAKILHTPISYVSIGPKRNQILRLTKQQGGL
jgi:adenylosuccinate synthase